eukprot:EG_transcript_4590
MAEESPSGTLVRTVSRREFRNVLLDGHNRARRAVGVPPLEWSDELADGAQVRAEMLAGVGDLRRASMLPRHVKESLCRFGARDSPGEAAAHCIQVFERCQEHYVPGTLVDNDNMADAGMYLQMVWQDTKYLGAGMATGPQGYFIVCRYTPPGNLRNQYPYKFPIESLPEEASSSQHDATHRASTPLSPKRSKAPVVLGTINDPAPGSPTDADPTGGGSPTAPVSPDLPTPGRSMAGSPGANRPVSPARKPMSPSPPPLRPPTSGAVDQPSTSRASFPSSSSSSAPHHSGGHSRSRTPAAPSGLASPVGEAGSGPTTASRPRAASAGDRTTLALPLSLSPGSWGSSSPVSRGSGFSLGGYTTSSSAHRAGLFRQAILAEHNLARAKFRAAPLRWSADLEAQARAYAKALAALGRLERSARAIRPEQGENLFYHPSVSMAPADAAVGACRSFESDGRLGTGSPRGRLSAFPALQYLQMVWPGSVELGAAFAVGSTGTFVVCRYSPAAPNDLPFSAAMRRSRSQPAARPVRSDSFRDLMLEGVNSLRHAVGVPPLAWSAQLELQAKARARTLAERGEEGEAEGEGVFWCSSTFHLSPEDVVDECCASLKREARLWTPGAIIPKAGDPKTKHYTQAVWRGSRIFAAVMATGPAGTVVVSRYFPAGNEPGSSPYKPLADPPPDDPAALSAWGADAPSPRRDLPHLRPPAPVGKPAP